MTAAVVTCYAGSGAGDLVLVCPAGIKTRMPIVPPMIIGLIEIEMPPATPQNWVGDEPIIEDYTFGHGSHGQRCRLCCANNYAGTLKHTAGCPGAAAEQTP